MRKNGFSLLELIAAITIFSLFCTVLYSLTHTVFRLTAGEHHTRIRFRREMHSVLDFLEDEIQEALTGRYTVYEPGSDWRRQETYVDFVCTIPSGGGPDLRFSPGTSHPKMQQVFLTRVEYRYTKNITNSEIGWTENLLSERILYVDRQSQLRLFARTERLNPENIVTGWARTSDSTRGRYFAPVSPAIENIEYFFWGNQSRDWSDDGTGNALRYWDSLEGRPGIHEKHQLPHAVKLVLTARYHPAMYFLLPEFRDVAGIRLVTFERVVTFKNRAR